MKADFYEIVVKGNHKGGVLYAPHDWPYPIASDGKKVKNWQRLVLELKDGPYRSFFSCVGEANVVSKAFMDVILSFVGSDNDYLEFLPVRIVSDKYGDAIYYILHFKKIFDVIDKDSTTYVPHTDAIMKMKLDQDKVKGLSIFNSLPVVNDIFVSDALRSAIIKNNLGSEIEFMPIFYGRKDY